MIDDILSVFDSWEPLEKARKPKGLSKWDKLQHVAHRLEGKSKDMITYTCAHPSHAGSTHILGSVVGTLHFLLGYANPWFHLASYHWQVMDPGVDDKAAESLQRIKGHPSRPELWKQAELEDKPEGDLELGVPHPSTADLQKKRKRDAESIRIVIGAGVYLAVPSEGLVYGEHNDHVYKWDLVKNSFMAAQHPEVVEAMEQQEEEVTKSISDTPCLISDDVKHRGAFSGEFAPEVYELVKSVFPRPGSIIPLDTSTGETIYGVVTEKSIDFFDRQGRAVEVEVWDLSCNSLDLCKSGDMYSSVVYAFGLNYLGLNKSELESFIGQAPSSHCMNSPLKVRGFPTPGFEDIEPVFIENLNKSVEIQGNTYRLIIRGDQ